MKAPQVTVLMAVRDGEKFLAEAVDSVLGQSLRDFELLIVDDGSTDATPALLRGLKDPRVRVLTNPSNIGLADSLNRGLAETRGEYVARIDRKSVV
jgi:glycosyltransferase involved in cell wall biosynthesis